MTEYIHEPTFYEQIAAIPGGDRIQTCLQCGTCGGSCPSGPDMDHTPREIFAMIMAGKREEVLKSNTFWYCLSCYACTVRCPQEIPITDVMYRLKYLANKDRRTTNASAFSKTFIQMIELFGRGYELGLAAQYYLTRRPLAALEMAPMAIGLTVRGRMALLPTRIKNQEGLRAILQKAKEIARQHDRQAGVPA